MYLTRPLCRHIRAAAAARRPLSASCYRPASHKDRIHPNVEGHREAQRLPNNPHLTNTTSTIVNDVPSVGADKAPPDLIAAVDSSFRPKDSLPENTERMTGGKSEMQVGEMEGASFKVEPLRREGEDPPTMRARLLCKLPLFVASLTSQTKAGSEERWNQICCSPPLPPPTSRRWIMANCASMTTF